MDHEDDQQTGGVEAGKDIHVFSLAFAIHMTAPNHRQLRTKHNPINSAKSATSPPRLRKLSRGERGSQRAGLSIGVD